MFTHSSSALQTDRRENDLNLSQVLKEKVQVQVLTALNVTLAKIHTTMMSCLNCNFARPEA